MRIYKLLITLLFFYSSLTFSSPSGLTKTDVEFCFDYAQIAVEQNQKNLQQHCGFKGLRWSDDQLGQMQWCMTVSKNIATAENQARQDLLADCQPQKINIQTFCSNYAQLAVEQNKQNKQHQCGFSGLRWSDNLQGQKQWCLSVDQTIAANENQIRQGLLDICLASANTATKNIPSRQVSSSPEVKSSSSSSVSSSSKIQQLFPQEAVISKVQALGLNDLESFLKSIRIPAYDFSLSESGRWLAQGGASNNDSSLKIWDLKQAKLLYLLGEEDGDSYTRLVFSPNEKYLIAGNNETTDVWDWKKARLLHRFKGYFLPSYQAFDSQGQLYLINKNRDSVIRVNLSSGQQEGKWQFAKKFEDIRGFAVSPQGLVALKVVVSNGVKLSVFDTYNNKPVYVGNLSRYSVYDREGNSISGRTLGFIDNQRLAIYNLESLQSQPFISQLNLKTGKIKRMRVANDMGISLADLERPSIAPAIQEKLCLVAPDHLPWKNTEGLKCVLKKQAIKGDYIVSLYEIRRNDQYIDKQIMLHDLQGHLLAYLGADSSARWYWLNAQTSELKNSGALRADVANPNRKPNIYHFPSHIVSLNENHKTAKQYRFSKTGINRLEVFMGANDRVKYKPVIKPSFGSYALSHDGHWLVAGGLDGDRIAHTDLWNLETQSYVKSFQSKIGWTDRALAFSPDDRYLVIYYGSTRGHHAPCMECSAVIDIWDMQKSQYKFSIPLLDRNNNTSAPVIFDNGDMYLNVNNKVVQRWNIKKERFVDIFRPRQKNEEVFSIVGNRGDLLAISVSKKIRNKDYSIKSATSWIEVWSVSKHKIINKINIMNHLVQGGLEFNTVFVSDKALAVATRLNDIIIRDALSGDILKTLVATKQAFGFSYHLSSKVDGILISSGQYVQRWDTATGKLLTSVNACQPDMPGLPTKRYAQLRQYNGFGSAKVSADKVISAFSCPQGGRSKQWNMKTGELKALFGKDYKGEWFWLNDQETLKSTIPPPPQRFD